MRGSAMPIILAGFAAVVASPAQAGSNATFVSGTGVDSGICTAAAPCRTLQYAFHETHAGGVITIVAPGSFAGVNITRSISIVANGVTAVIQSATGCTGGIYSAAICISPGASQVTLRGLTIDPVQQGPTQIGVWFKSAGVLDVQNCVIRGAGSSGIWFEPTSSSELFVSNSTVSENPGVGIYVLTDADGNYAAAFDHARVEGNTAFGLYFNVSGGTVNGTVTNSVFASNSTAIRVDGYSGANLTIHHSTISTSAADGIAAVGGLAALRVGGSSITGNFNGVDAVSGAQILSFGTNELTANGTDGSFTGTVAPR